MDGGLTDLSESEKRRVEVRARGSGRGVGEGVKQRLALGPGEELDPCHPTHKLVWLRLILSPMWEAGLQECCAPNGSDNLAQSLPSC